MKRALSILLLFSYLLAIGGLQVVQHYCGGTLVSSSFTQTKSCCGKAAPATKAPKDCCKNKVKQFKLNDFTKLVRQLPAIAAVYTLAPLVQVPAFKAAGTAKSITSRATAYLKFRPPASVPLYILFNKLKVFSV